ncbi:mitogen-activated protein kinase [Knufia obscura]|uniref:cyclin-dependent kinase n=1 Tax=Knufia obscura TaxID=1635080 RepID=A0ABR0RVM0_9EURO|nr:mitogen-activated protein kinase [Knufia obscura]
MDVSFSKRFENIMKITKHLCEQGKNASIAKAEASNIEEQFLKVANTTDEYQELCDDYVEVHQAIPTPTTIGLDNEAMPDEIFNTDGPTLGKYEWATFHSDGQASTVYKAKSTNVDAMEKVMALKVMRPDHMEPPHNAHREARILEKARNDNVIPLLESFQQSGGRLVLVFPFLRQDLENLLRTDSLTKAQSRTVFEGLFGALAHLHSFGIIHRDIKPSNILLKSMDGPAYLIDFGISWAEGDPDSEDPAKKMTDVGTTAYRPPEILFGHRAYDSSLDMWAAGCVVAEMVTKDHSQLFDAGDLGSELALIKSIFSTLGTPTDDDWPSAKKYPDWGKVKWKEFPAKPWKEILPGASKTAIDFVSRTVCYETTRRMTAVQALSHPIAEEFA